MRKFYRDFFYIPKYGKVQEKVMLTRVTMTVAIVIMCLAAMGFTAYAYFSCDVTSGFNTIQAANFASKIVQITDKNGQAVEVKKTNNTYTAELKANEEYSIVLEHADSSTAKTGFVVITADNCSNKYHTQQIGRDSTGKSETLTFQLVPSADTTVTFRSHWGTSSMYPEFVETGKRSNLYIVNNGHVALFIMEEQQEEPSTEDPVVTPPVSTQPPATQSTTPPSTTQPPATQSTTPPSTTEPPATQSTTPPSTTEPPATQSTTPPSTTEPPTTQSTTPPSTTEPPATQGATSPEQPIPSGTPETSEPASTPESSGTQEPYSPVTTEPATSEPAENTETGTDTTEETPSAADSTETTESSSTETGEI